MEIDDYIVADDRTLAELVVRGDDRAFEFLFDRYKEAILRLFIQRTGSELDADDLLQETFIKVYINIHRYDSAYTFGQWIYAIARNTFVDFLRKQRSDDLPIDEKFKAPPSSMPTPEERIINQQKRGQIEHYLHNMSPRYRQLIVLRFFDEYSYEEIAAKLALPLGTVKTQIHRAREQMCRMITENERH
ncbi:MAG: sigma-70 family RNA polymerase sigma factor [Alistipes sp.]|nr:sigma-70 family RNA polymerase sigma factor [Alistipes sp.]